MSQNENININMKRIIHHSSQKHTLLPTEEMSFDDSIVHGHRMAFLGYMASGKYDVNRCTGSMNRTVLEWAYCHGWFDVVEELLQDPDTNPNAHYPGEKPMIAYVQHQPTMKLLLLHKKVVITENPSPQQVLKHVFRFGDAECVAIALADPRFTDVVEKGYVTETLIHNRSPGLAVALLRDGRIHVAHYEDDRGLTFFDRVARSGNLEMTKFIIAHANDHSRWGHPLNGGQHASGAFDLYVEYFKDPSGVRARVRGELGVDVESSRLLMAKVVLVSDGYLELDTGQILVWASHLSYHCPEFSGTDVLNLIKLEKAHTFFNIMTKLPVELRALICNRVYGIAKDTQLFPETEMYQKILNVPKRSPAPMGAPTA